MPPARPTLKFADDITFVPFTDVYEIMILKIQMLTVSMLMYNQSPPSRQLPPQDIEGGQFSHVVH